MENQRRLRSFERNLEDLNRQLFNLQKSLNEKANEKAKEPAINVNKVIDTKINEMRSELQNDMKSTLANIAPLVDVLEGIQKSFQIHKNKIDLRMEQIEERVKSVLSISNILSSKDEEKIVTMFNNGKLPEEIAKELRITKGEVDFVLKLINLGENKNESQNEIEKENDVNTQQSEV
jgi:hypothetical protein